MEFVHAQGTQLYFDGKPLKLRGFGIGTWLNMEHFMLRLPTPDSMIRTAFEEVYGQAEANRFFHSLQDCFIGPDDFRFLRDLGVNFIRVPFNYRLLLSDETGELREEGFQALERLLDLCEEYQIFCMPDLHTAPGGQNPDWHSDNRTGWPQFWEFQVFQQQITTLWGHIARRLSRYRYLLGYDVLNEPAMAGWEPLNRFYRETVKEILQNDSNHLVVLEGDGFAMDFSGLDSFADPRVMLSFHYYPTVWHPDLLAPTLHRAERRRQMEEGLVKLAGIRERFGKPVICGEAGYDLDFDNMPFCMDLLEDTLDLFEAHDIPWALWTYKDACTMGIAYPRLDSPWMEFVSKLMPLWDHHSEMRQAEAFTAQLAEGFGGVSDWLAYQSQFRIRGVLYAMQREKLLLPLLRETPVEKLKALAESFLFANCGIHPEYEALIRRYTAGRKDGEA
ncbi:glycoside hydrolase family 5 protein [Ruminococcaceae bacterium OttesenSCG-928-L11]|nr:glycoside hydrolase family 5 protein [Ruminococcaceae bacterium OttesenSCG-928-L11]